MGCNSVSGIKLGNYKEQLNCCLLSGRTNPSLRCVLMELNRSPHQDSAQDPVCSCSPVQTFTAGSSSKLLTKNAVFKSPANDSTLVCAGDEGSHSTMVGKNTCAHFYVLIWGIEC